MKVSCGIIKDLLPLYHDNVCSAESRDLVDEHIKDCSSCESLLSVISDEITCPVNTADETKPIRAIQKVWKKDKAKSFVKGTLMTVLICAMLTGVFIGLTQWKIIPVSADLLEVTEVCLLSDGRIIFHLSVNDDKNLSNIKFSASEDGSFYMTPMRSVIEGKQPAEIGKYSRYLDIDMESSIYANRQVNGVDIKITSYYAGPPDNGILIWEEGMELPAASEEIEKRFSENN